MPASPAARRVLVVLNAHSGAGCDAERARGLAAQFTAHGLEARIELVQGGELRAAVERARQDGITTIVAGGGDGTQGAVAGCVAGTAMVQGVLPLGTLNHFAKDLGIPLDPAEAVRVIAAGHVRRVDVGEVNGQVFLNNSSLGLYPEIVRARELQQLHLGRGKWRALLSAIARTTRHPRRLAVRIASEGDEQLRRTPFVFIGNNRYVMEGLRIGERARLDGGELALYTVRRRGRLALALLALRALLHRLDQAADFEVLTADGFVISTRDPRIRVATDGETAMMDTPLHYAVRPQALQVLAPPPA